MQISKYSALVMGFLASLSLVACPPPQESVDAGADATVTDTVAPTIVSHSPESDAQDVALNSAVSVTMSEAIDCASVDSSMFQILGVSADLSCSDATVTLLPQNALQAMTEYRVYFFASGLLRDLAGNTLNDDLSWRFTTGIGADTEPPQKPSADTPALPASSDQARAILGGQCDANTALEMRRRLDGGAWQDWIEIVPSAESTSWISWIDLQIGLNEFELRSRDLADRYSESLPISSVRVVQELGALDGAQVELRFSLRDLWDDIGDEFAVWRDGRTNMNHFSVDIWVEGPFASGETCHYDASSQTRTNPRYVATLVRGRDANETPPYLGFWEYNNYRSPNYLAALITSGQWAYSAFAMPVDVERRNSSGEQWPVSASCEGDLMFIDSFGQCQPGMMQVPVIDGVTEASIRSDSAAPDAPGSWNSARTYTWDLHDRFGRLVSEGDYLISAVITVDRAQMGPAYDAAMRAADRETCWDRPEHDVIGAHRLEAMLHIQAGQDQSLLLDERGLSEVVDACDPSNHPINAIDTCACTGDDANLWPCNSSNPNPNARIGESVQYLVPDFAEQGHAARLRFCAQGSCE